MNEFFVLIGVNSDFKECVKDVLECENIMWWFFWDGGLIGGFIVICWNVCGWLIIYVFDYEGVICYKGVCGEVMDKVVDMLFVEMKGDDSEG